MQTVVISRINDMHLYQFVCLLTYGYVIFR